MLKTSLTTTFGSLQWLFFIFANVVVVPISIGVAFELPSYEVATIQRSSFIFTGVACMLQGLIGHRFPIMEGPSGVIWALVLNLSFSASSLGMSLQTIGGGIATGMIVAGIFTIIISVFRLYWILHKLITHMVMSVYLFLLTFQLIMIFFMGMLKINEDGKLDLPITLFSIGIVIFVSMLNIVGNKGIGNFSILIGMIVGWLGYSLLFSTEVQNISRGVSLTLFPLGQPNLEIGIIAITFLGCLVNLSNTTTSVEATAKLYQDHELPTEQRYRSSYLLTGLYAALAPLFGLISYSPYASSIGFLESTKMLKKKPFLIGGALMVLLGIIPALGSLLATLPITVGNAVLFVAYIQLFGTSIKSLNGYTFTSKTIYRLAIPVLVGVCIMTLDSKIFTSLPIYLQPLIGNGFIMGVLLSVCLEKMINWEKVIE
ncbi:MULTISPECIES: uracil/xanthine transporter [Metabacillus]|uniref:Uracil/xanthine transporter n=2 Tax=Metabacillus TaxID=2675233 RepID=A0A179SQN5_9BACI|nr:MULTISPECIES: uracil/xanthine transporter [Metabacillus]OAS82613.1 uracil/xanthine transporter [Metabacillus litoralis]QNF26798.1 uracil/xanthine transporter [Metabacillus sp. KUDC1714]